MKRGLFITFEGIEGCGKSTQTKAVADYFEENKFSFIVTREPGGTLISEKIREILLDNANKEMNPETELLLYMASRSQHTGTKIVPALDEGKHVICDRFYDSTLAYQGAARDLDKEFIDLLIDFATYSTSPDITFLLDITVEESEERICHRGKDRMEQESKEFHQKVRNEFLNLAKEYNNRYIVIDGTQDPQIITERIMYEIKQKLDGKNETK
jgi:dTMP kinase